MRSLSFIRTVVLALLTVSCSASSVRGTEPVFTKQIAFSILEDYDKGQDLNQVKADFVLFKELGIDTWRGSFGWDDYEPSPGQYDLAWLHQFVQLAADHQIALRPYLGYTPEWAAKPGGEDAFAWNNPPADISDWYRFVFRMASEMKQYPHLLSFEIYNEENSSQWWDGTAEEYSRVLKTGSAAIRAAQGNYRVLIGGLTYPDTDWMTAICGTFGSGDSFDVLPIHAYPETWTPEGVEVENYLNGTNYVQNTFLPTVDKECGQKPIWLNEIGYATTPGKRSERDQANWWARAISTFIAAPRVEHIGIYEIREPMRTVGVIGEPENYYLGLTYRDGKKKLAFDTVKLLVDLFDTGVITVADAEMEVDVVEGEQGELYYHLFIRPDGIQVLLVWDKTNSPVVRIGLPRSGTKVLEYALDGTIRPYQELEGRTLGPVKLAPGDVKIFTIAP